MAEKIFKALRRGGEDKVREALEAAGPQEVAKARKKGRGLLHTAAEDGEEWLLRLLLEEQWGLDVNALDDDRGWTPLIFTVCGNTDETARSLLLKAKGVDINKRDRDDGYTALHWAAKMDSPAIIKQLLAHKAELEAVSRDSKDTPLLCALTEGSEDAALLLLSRGADVNAKNDEGLSALHLAVLNTSENTVKSLLDHPQLNIEKCLDVGGNTPLHVACLNAIDAVVPLLKDRGFDENQTNAHGVTPLELADAVRKEKKAEELKAAQVKEERQELKKEYKQRQVHKTEVTQFLIKYGLGHLADLFYARKVHYLPFPEDETRLKKMGLSQNDRAELFAAIEQAEWEKEEEARKAEEALRATAARQQRYQGAVAVGVVGLLFVVVFVILKVAISRRAAQGAPRHEF